MPYIVTHCWYPVHKADEAGKKYMEVMQKYPPDESLGKEIVPVAVTSCKDGLETLTIMEVERQKVGEALERQKSFMIEFKSVEGFNYEIKTWSTAEEGLARLDVS